MSDLLKPNLLRCRGLFFQYGQKNILSNINVDIKKGKSYAFLGPSGCGKSTLLSLIAKLTQPTKGHVNYSSLCQKKISMVFQDYGLFPWKNIRQNLDLAFNLRQLKSNLDSSTLLKELEIDALLDRLPHELSGGQKQKVAIARSLLFNPDLLLLDEPFSAIDALSREKLQNKFKTLWQRQQFSMILVTHDIFEAVFLAEKIFILSKNPAKIECVIDNEHTKEINLRSSNAYFQLCNLVRDKLRGYI